MALVEFRCPTCGQGFQVPGEKIPPAGARGRCKGCGAGLGIFPDGRTSLLEPQAAAGSAAPKAPSGPPPPPDDPIWKTKRQDSGGNWEVRSSLMLADLRQLILDDVLIESDLVQVMDGDWTPARSIPALDKFFAERLDQLREKHGDEEGCAHHRDTHPGWQCLKCGDYLCESCVVNRPLMEGGEARYLCLVCEFETRTLKGRSLLSGALKGFLKKR